MSYKFYFILLLSMSIALPGLSQTTRANFGLGLNHVNFQDARFSNQRISGSISKLEVGLDRSGDNSYAFFNTGLALGFNQIPNLDDKRIGILELTPEFGYMKNIIQDGFYVGIAISLFDYSIRDTEALNNNSNFFLHSNDISVVARYVKPLTKRINLELQSEMGLLSFLKYAPSFTSNIPQNIIDNSLYSYQNAETRNPLSWKYMGVKTGFDQTLLKFKGYITLGNRISAGYYYKVRTFSDFDGYPLTMAGHSLTVRYNFISRTK